MSAMGAQDYARWYAAQSRRTVDDLRDKLHLMVAPCRCSHPDCRGWVMIGRRSAEARTRADLVAIQSSSPQPEGVQR